MAPRKPDALSRFDICVGLVIGTLLVAYAVREIATGREIPVAIHAMAAVIVGRSFGRGFIKSRK